MSVEGPLSHHSKNPAQSNPSPLDRALYGEHAHGLDEGPAFYARASAAVVALCGHETGINDFHSAVGLLNSRLRLGLNETDCRAFGFMLTSLAKSGRFGGDLHIGHVEAENSAAHSCHAVVLAHEIFRRAGLLAPEQLTPEANSLRRTIAVGCLIHDMGEILGELSSLAQRNTHHGLEELPDIEREIFRITLTEAYRAARAEPPDASGFQSFVSELRGAAKLSERGIAGTSPYEVAKVLAECARAQELSGVPREVSEAVEAALRLYDMAELKKTAFGQRSVFIGNAVKVIEHVQGLRHFMRFARGEPSPRRLHLFSPETHLDANSTEGRPRFSQAAIPLQLISSRRFLGNVRYIETELPRLFSSASAAEEGALADALRDAAYQSQIEWFSVSRPFIDRTTTQELPELVSLQKQLSSASDDEKASVLDDIDRLLKLSIEDDRNRFLRSRAELPDGQADGPRLLPCESSPRIILLYLEALRLGFQPKSETPLMLLEEIPSELRGFLSPNTEPPPAQARGLFDGLSVPPRPA